MGNISIGGSISTRNNAERQNHKGKQETQCFFHRCKGSFRFSSRQINICINVAGSIPYWLFIIRQVNIPQKPDGDNFLFSNFLSSFIQGRNGRSQHRYNLQKFPMKGICCPICRRYQTQHNRRKLK